MLIDNQSSDNSVGIAKRYEKLGLKIIENSEDVGPWESKRIGIQR
jgi:hypothetical protein